MKSYKDFQVASAEEVASALFSAGLRISPNLRFKNYTVVPFSWVKDKLLPAIDFDISALGLTYLRKPKQDGGKFVCQQFAKVASVISNICNASTPETDEPLGIGELYYVPFAQYDLPEDEREGHCINVIMGYKDEEPENLIPILFDAQTPASIKKLFLNDWPLVHTVDI